MRIAFTSCFSAESFRKQPVWDEIAASEPDHLVLLGDSIYLDCGDIGGIADLQQLSDTAFATRALDLYRQQVAIANFHLLVARAGLSTHVIWDDHDFLWNDADGAGMDTHPRYGGFVHASRAAFACFAESLRSRLAQPIPYVSQVDWAGARAPGYRLVDLGGGVQLHLTDGRTWRGAGALLGATQFAALVKEITARPDEVHLIASGSVFEASSGNCWLDSEVEHDALLELARTYRLLILSGDIHDNNLAAYDVGGGRHLYEVTSSGAAVKTRVTSGSLQRNWGSIDIGPRSISYGIWKRGAKQYEGTIDRASWRVRPSRLGQPAAVRA